MKPRTPTITGHLERMARHTPAGRNASIIAGVLLAVSYPLLSLIPQSLPAPLIQPAFILFWTLLGLASMRAVRGSPLLTSAKSLGRIPLLAGFTYIVVYAILGGLLVGFGYNALSFTPLSIALNTAWILSMAYGVEMTRLYMIEKTGRPLAAVMASSILFTLVLVPLYAIPEITGPGDIARLLGSRFNTFTILLLSGILTLAGGAQAGIAFHATARLGTTLLPILPNLNWIQEVFVALITLAVIYASISRIFGSSNGRGGGTGSVVAGTILVALIWLSQGLVGYYMVVVTSGSMTPGIQVGDVAVAREVESPEDLEIGDIVLYERSDGKLVLHRIVDTTRDSQGSTLYITKGDANPEPDPDPVAYKSIVGELLFTVPKAGYPSIIIKEAILGGIGR
ncbi:MAG: signal peptidase I [Desulfurococcales archaeon]|nr:signal peptidase I [Desulfurococcales archaeon]